MNTTPAQHRYGVRWHSTPCISESDSLMDANRNLYRVLDNFTMTMIEHAGSARDALFNIRVSQIVVHRDIVPGTLLSLCILCGTAILAVASTR